MSVRRFASALAGIAAVAALLRVLGPGDAELSAVLADPSAVATRAPDALVVCAVAGLAWLTWAWAATGLLLTAGGALPGAMGRGARRLARVVLPGTARRAAALALGVGLGVSAPAAAVAAPASPPGLPAGAVALDVFVPDWPTAGPSPATPAVPAAADPPAGDWPVAHHDASSAPVRPATGEQEPHVVVSGECLWQIAAENRRATIDEEPTDPVVADAVRAWWATNAGVVGPDPDLIRPGQVLLPPGSPSPLRESR